MSATYAPGQCNIGRSERRKRLAVGIAGFLVAVAFEVALAVRGWPVSAHLLTAIPLFAGFIGLFQYRRGFCAGFAARGVYDVDGDSGEVTDESARAADRAAARRLYRDAAVAAATGTVVVTLAAVVA